MSPQTFLFGVAVCGIALIGCAKPDSPGARIRSSAEQEDQATATNTSALTAINVLLELDAATVTRAKAANARLRANFPQGFALDASHVPHITLLQCYVRTRNLDDIYGAVRRALAEERAAGWKLTALGYSYTLFGDTGLASVVIESMPQLVRLQRKLIDAVSPFAATGGTAAAFVTTPGPPGITAATIEYVENFVADHAGDNYKPHITVGVAQEELVRKMNEEPLAPFTITVTGVAIYQLGNLGTARRKLWDPTP